MKNAVVVSGILLTTLLTVKGLGEGALALSAVACVAGIIVIIIAEK